MIGWNTLWRVGGIELEHDWARASGWLAKLPAKSMVVSGGVSISIKIYWRATTCNNPPPLNQVNLAMNTHPFLDNSAGDVLLPFPELLFPFQSGLETNSPFRKNIGPVWSTLYYNLPYKHYINCFIIIYQLIVGFQGEPLVVNQRGWSPKNPSWNWQEVIRCCKC